MSATTRPGRVNLGTGVRRSLAVWSVLLFVAAIPISLVWDFSWESTIGIDRVWAPPHTTMYLAVTLAAFTVMGLVRGVRLSASDLRLGRWHAPLGGWIMIWGAVAFLTATLFDRWWQSAYGLSAGIWHPPQILKCVAFFAVVLGGWLVEVVEAKDDTLGFGAFVGFGGLSLALITVVTLTSTYPNRQHSATFYKLACATYPIVLLTLGTSGKRPFAATLGAAVYTALLCGIMWVLPLIPAKPQVGPIYNPMNHMLPPPFPLLLILPALALDLFKQPLQKFSPWIQAVVAGLSFFIVLLAAQWTFAEFLLSDLADNWFFMGGGRHWPFFLKIDALARTEFWEIARDKLNVSNAVIAGVFAVVAARFGLWLGSWMNCLKR